MASHRRRHSFSACESAKWTGKRNHSDTTLSCLKHVRIVRRPSWNSSTRLNKMDSSIDIPLTSSPTGTPVPANDVVRSIDQNDDLITGIQIYNLWSESLTKDKMSSEIAWNRCRRLALDALDVFRDRVEGLEKIIGGDVVEMKLLHVDAVLEKKNEIEAATFEVEDLDMELKQVSKAFQTVAQCLPACVERDHIKQTMKEARIFYFSFLNRLVLAKEKFRTYPVYLGQYLELGASVKGWLDAAEVRCELFITGYNNHELMLDNEEVIETIYAELCSQKDPYENYLEAGEGLIDLNEGHEEIHEDIIDTSIRWDRLCSGLEKCTNRLEVAKKVAMDSKKSDVEKIEKQIRCEERKCTCHDQFVILKLGEGKYKFGSSKIVRLVRIHGSSIVVRVGGGWQFLYDFLLKNDPCRAKQLEEKKNLDSLNLSALNLNPIDDQKGEFSFTVRRYSQQNWTPQNRLRPNSVNGSLGSAASSENGDDSLKNTPQASETPLSTPKTAPARKNNLYNKRLSKSSDKINRRLSLVERQIDFAEKRKLKKPLAK